MGTTRKVVLELPEEDAVLLDALVSHGVYASATAFVSANLLAERLEDPELDRWIETVGQTRWAKIKQDPSELLTPDEFMREMEEHRRLRRAAKSQ